MRFDQRKLHKVTMPEQGTLDANGINELTTFLQHRADLPALPPDWEYIWMKESNRRKGEKIKYVGALPTRISKFYWEEHSINLSKSILEQVGIIAKRHLNDGKSYYLDFTTNFDWVEGNFGDPDSCYFERRTRLQALEDNGAYAVRFYRSDVAPPYDEFEALYSRMMESSIYEKRQFYDIWGLGRAWLAPDIPLFNTFTIFNGYGFEEDSLLLIARILSVHFNLPYKQVCLYNEGEGGGLVYINSGSYHILHNENGDVRVERKTQPRGFMIGTAEQIAKYGRVNPVELGYSTNYYDEEDDE